MIELVVFDMIGTTIRDGDAVNAAFSGVLRSRGVETTPQAINDVMGLPKPEAIRILLDQFGRPHGIVPTPEIIDALHDEMTERMRVFYATDPAVGEIEGTSDVFALLRRTGIKVALNSGFYRPIAEPLLTRLGWHAPGTIDATITSDEAPRGRPHPDMIRQLMSRFGIADPLGVAKVGDTAVDLQEGTNAGCCYVIGVTTGSFTRARLEAFPHTHIVASIRDVPAIVLGQTPAKFA